VVLRVFEAGGARRDMILFRTRLPPEAKQAKHIHGAPKPQAISDEAKIRT
jgi:hypothetical protein